MRHTLDYIRDKPSDFIICEKCGSINWHDNKECVNCSSRAFRRIDEFDMEYLNEEINEYGYNVVLNV